MKKQKGILKLKGRKYEVEVDLGINPHTKKEFKVRVPLDPRFEKSMKHWAKLLKVQLQDKEVEYSTISWRDENNKIKKTNILV